MTEINTSSNTIFNKDIVIKQPVDGFRFSADALFLSWFIYQKRGKGNAVEVGAGTGVISILLQKRGFSGSITAVEIENEIFSLLKENIKDNTLEHFIRPIRGDFFSAQVIPLEERFDIVFSNPPFFTPESSTSEKNSLKYKARHEISFTIPKLCEKSSKILKKGGNFFAIFPVERMQYLLSNLDKNMLFATEILLIKEFSTKTPSLFLVHARKGKNKHAIPLKNIDCITVKDDKGKLTEVSSHIFYDTSE